jgi:hypothetical protein
MLIAEIANLACHLPKTRITIFPPAILFLNYTRPEPIIVPFRWRHTLTRTKKAMLSTHYSHRAAGWAAL